MPKIPLGPQTVESAHAMTNMMHAITAVRQQETQRRRMEFEMRMARQESVFRQNLARERSKLERERHDLNMLLGAYGVEETKMRLAELPAKQKLERRERELGIQLREKRITREEFDLEAAKQKQEWEAETREALPPIEARRKWFETKLQWQTEKAQREMEEWERERKAGQGTPRAQEAELRIRLLERQVQEYERKTRTTPDETLEKELKEEKMRSELAETRARRAVLSPIIDDIKGVESGSGLAINTAKAALRQDMLSLALGKSVPPRHEQKRLLRSTTAEIILEAWESGADSAQVPYLSMDYPGGPSLDSQEIRLTPDVARIAYTDMLATKDRDFPERVQFQAGLRRSFSVQNADRMTGPDLTSRPVMMLLGGDVVQPGDTHTTNIRRIHDKALYIAQDLVPIHRGQAWLGEIRNAANGVLAEYEQIMTKAATAGQQMGVGLETIARLAERGEATTEADLAGLQPQIRKSARQLSLELQRNLLRWKQHVSMFYDLSANTFYGKLRMQFGTGGNLGLGGDNSMYADWVMERAAETGPEAFDVRGDERLEGIIEGLEPAGPAASPGETTARGFRPTSEETLKSATRPLEVPSRAGSSAEALIHGYAERGRQYVELTRRDEKAGHRTGVENIANLLTLDSIQLPSQEEVLNALSAIETDATREQMRQLYNALLDKTDENQRLPSNSTEALAFIGMLSEGAFHVTQTRYISPIGYSTEPNRMRYSAFIQSALGLTGEPLHSGTGEGLAYNVLAAGQRSKPALETRKWERLD